MFRNGSCCSTTCRFNLTVSTSRVQRVNSSVKVFLELLGRTEINILNSCVGNLVHISWQEPRAFHLRTCHLSVDTCPAFDVNHGAGDMRTRFSESSFTA